MEQRTFVELPRDEYGNRGYTNSGALVILADYEPGQGKLGTYGGAGRLHIIEPEEFKRKWPTVLEFDLSGGHWIDVDHPPGPISEKEYVVLLRTKTSYIPRWMLEVAEERARST